MYGISIESIVVGCKHAFETRRMAVRERERLEIQVSDSESSLSDSVRLFPRI